MDNYMKFRLCDEKKVKEIFEAHYPYCESFSECSGLLDVEIYQIDFDDAGKLEEAFVQAEIPFNRLTSDDGEIVDGERRIYRPATENNEMINRTIFTDKHGDPFITFDKLSTILGDAYSKRGSSTASESDIIDRLCRAMEKIDPNIYPLNQFGE